MCVRVCTVDVCSARVLARVRVLALALVRRCVVMSAVASDMRMRT